MWEMLFKKRNSWNKMKLTLKQLSQILNYGFVKVILTILLICLTIRLLPDLAPVHPTDIAQNQFSMEFVDRNGLALGTLLTRDQQNTTVVALNKVSPQFIQAILAAEDGGFYQHGALDIKAILRATKEAIQMHRIVSGASTITMQLARMLSPSTDHISGKLGEIWLSWRLAAGMNKDDILSAYINRLPMGGNIYGVAAAAWTYFSIPASDLNLAQATLLAAIPNNPTYFNPYEHWERLKLRQKYVLHRMVQDGYITPSLADRTYIEKVVFQSHPQGIIAAPHFLFWLANQIYLQKPQAGKTASFLVHTTIDRPLQQFVESQVKQIISNLANNHVSDAAALVINNHSGEVLAYVGAPDYFNQTKLGGNDGVQALRQPGSTLKPFVYELALENRVIRPNTILADVPVNYAIPTAKLYSPTDYTKNFLGPVRVRIALANSLNVPAVRVLSKVGVQNFLNRLHELGFSHLDHPAEYYGLGLTLGSGEVSLWELARAYVTMARLGESIPLITSDLPNLPPPSVPIISTSGNRRIWELIIDMLSDRHGRATAFGVNSILNLPFAAAVKTGTSSNFRDTWTVGFTTDYTVATWVGNFDGTPMEHVSGVTGAAPLWSRILLRLHENSDPADFPPPSGLEQLPICATTGLKPTANCLSIVQEYLFPEDKATYEHPDSFSLSSDYDEWLSRQQNANHLINSFGNKLRIISPHNGDLFLLYPGDRDKQELEFKVLGANNQPVEWYLNGEKLLTQSHNSFFWQLQPGSWRLSVKSPTENDSISFHVELARSLPKYRGFSVKD